MTAASMVADPEECRRFLAEHPEIRFVEVFFTGMTIHGSFANRAVNRPRKAFATHYVAEGTWLPRVDIQATIPVDEAALAG